MTKGMVLALAVFAQLVAQRLDAQQEVPVALRQLQRGTRIQVQLPPSYERAGYFVSADSI